MGKKRRKAPIPATFRIIVFVHSHRCSQWSSRRYASSGRGWLTPGLPAEAAADTRSPDIVPRWVLLGKTWKFMLTRKWLPKMVRPDWLDGGKSGEQCSRTLATKRHSSLLFTQILMKSPHQHWFYEREKLCRRSFLLTGLMSLNTLDLWSLCNKGDGCDNKKYNGEAHSEIKIPLKLSSLRNVDLSMDLFPTVAYRFYLAVYTRQPKRLLLALLTRLNKAGDDCNGCNLLPLEWVCFDGKSNVED